MNNEITTEILANAVDATKKSVKIVSVEKTLKLEIEGQKKEFKLVNKAASSNISQLNAMAIAPVNSDGTVDYNNCAVAYAGTNTWGETGRNGSLTAVGAIDGLSSEYYDAVDFLKVTQGKIAKKNGKITDVAGFSQSGGYMMKMAAKYGQAIGFKTTSFDDWGGSQFSTLSKPQQTWLIANPAMLTRYQNDSWADLSRRDHKYGNIQGIIGIGDHNTLSKYFSGNALDLDSLAKDGIFAPNMSKIQVERAAKNWIKKNRNWDPFANPDAETTERIKTYLNRYGTYATKAYGLQMKRLNQLRSHLLASGGGLSANGKIYLDSEAARIIVEKAATDFEIATENILKVYQNAIRHAQDLWQDTLTESRWMGSLLEEWEIMSCLSDMGATQYTIVTLPCKNYQAKIDKITNMAYNFNALTNKINAKITDIVARDSELAQQLRGI